MTYTEAESERNVQVKVHNESARNTRTKHAKTVGVSVNHVYCSINYGNFISVFIRPDVVWCHGSHAKSCAPLQNYFPQLPKLS